MMYPKKKQEAHIEKQFQSSDTFAQNYDSYYNVSK